MFLFAICKLIQAVKGKKCIKLPKFLILIIKYSLLKRILVTDYEFKTTNPKQC